MTPATLLAEAVCQRTVDWVPLPRRRPSPHARPAPVPSLSDPSLSDPAHLSESTSVSPSPCTTSRLLLRSWRPDDQGHLVQAADDPLIARWTNRPEPFDLAAVARFIEVTTAAPAANHGMFYAVTAHPPDSFESTPGGILGGILGGVAASRDVPPAIPPGPGEIPPEPFPDPSLDSHLDSHLTTSLVQVEVGYWLTPAARGRGVGTEALAAFCALVEDAFTRAGAPFSDEPALAARACQLFARVDVRNIPSLHLARRCGFRDAALLAEPEFAPPPGALPGSPPPLREVSYLVRSPQYR